MAGRHRARLRGGRGAVEPSATGPRDADRLFVKAVEIDFEAVPTDERDDYPFDLAAVRSLHGLELTTPVTYFVGENGSGKSTLLEAIAAAAGFNAEGGTRNFAFETRGSHSELHRYLTLSRGDTPRDGFFLRAESYFNLATEIERLDAIEGAGPKVIESFGGRYLHEQSHGESFFALFENRLGANGLYILDEPEAALSPDRQIQFLARLHDLVSRGAQFLIATHAPIVLAYPDATIHQIDEDGLQRTTFDECELVATTRMFLENPAALLHHLLKPGDDESG